MVQRVPQYRPRRVNRYVPALAYDARVIHTAPYQVEFGAPAIAAAANILGTTSIAVAGSTTTLLNDGNTDPVVAATQSEFPYGPGFGRCLQVVADGAATSTVTISGRDYLGQPMTEIFTLNGAVAVIGVKAFKYVDRVAFAATAARSITVGTTDKLGLPFCMRNVISEELDGVRVATLGTLVAASFTDPQTATTTDPRGTYDPQSTLNGTARLSATFWPNNRVNAAGNGGLYGLAHYSA